MNYLSPKKQRFVDFIRDFTYDNNRPPTFVEIMAGLDIHSLGTVNWYVNELEKEKPVIFCGDLNVAHKEDDLANPQSNKTTKSRPGNAGFTNEERASFDNLINAGFIDTFREFTKGNGHYSWWSYMGKHIR